MAQMNLNYRERKQAKTIVLAKLNDAHVMILRRFNPDTGKEEVPEQIGVSIAQFQERRGKLLEEIEQIDEIIADLQSTKKTFGEIIAEASGVQRVD